jgi:hypothetical protein
MKIEEIAGLDRRLGELRKISRSLRHCYENRCNYEITPRQEKREENLEKKAINLGAELGFKTYLQGDPRGCAVYLVPAEWTDEYTDSHYSSGFAIY